MNNPKRYGFPWLECDATDEAYMAENGMTELKDGGFVLWQDYALLKSENDQLEAQVEAQAQRCADYEDLVKHYKHQRDEAYNESFDWQPIETAPKDGTWVTLGTDTPDAPCGIESLDCWFPAVCQGRYVRGSGWMRCSEYSVNIEPTHWMHLPKPPTK